MLKGRKKLIRMMNICMASAMFLSIPVQSGMSTVLAEDTDPVEETPAEETPAEADNSEETPETGNTDPVYTDTEYDFTSHITDISVEINGSTISLEELSAYTGPLTEDDSFYVNVDYELPSGTLLDENGQIIRTITYTASSALTLRQVSSGDVRNSANVKIGTYKIEGSKVSITFYDDIAKNNATGGQAVSGFVTWEASMSSSQVSESGSTTVEFDATHRITLTYFQMEKSAQLSEDKQTIYWSVALNAYGADMTGYTLSDVMYETAGSGSSATETAVTSYNPTTVTLTDSSGNTKTITLPYTFTGTDGIDPKGSYTVTYSTSVNNIAIGKTGLRNYVTLSKDNHTITDDAKITVDVLNPLKKNTNSKEITYSDDGNTAYVQFTLTVTTPENRVIPAPFSLNDILNQSEISYSAEQIHAIKTAMDQALSELNLNLNYTFTVSKTKDTGAGVAYEEMDESATYKSFRFRFHDDFPANTTLKLTYYATVDMKNYYQARYVSNSANITGQGSVSSGLNVSPKTGEFGFTKKDLNTGKELSSGTYDYDSSYLNATQEDENRTNGLITAGTKRLLWTVRTRIPNDYKLTEDLTVVEDLPAGTSLEDYVLVIMDDANKGKAVVEIKEVIQTVQAYDSYGNAIEGLTYKVNGYKADHDGEPQFDVIISPDTANARYGASSHQRIRMYVYYKLGDDGSAAARAYSNTSYVLMPNGGRITNTVKTTVTYTEPETTEVLSKSASSADSDNNVSYSILINPEGKDLVEDGDQIELEDVLSFTLPETGNLEARLEGASILVEKQTGTDESGQPVYETVPESEYNLTYRESEDTGTSTNYRRMSMTLQDNAAYRITYQYHASGTVGISAEILNVVKLKFSDEVLYEDQKEVKFYIQRSAAGANTQDDRITIRKVDYDNQTKLLSGVVFGLYQADTAGGGTKIGNSYTTQNGQFYLVKDTNIQTNTLYYLIEEQGPEGYSWNSEDRIYFYVPDTDNPVELSYDMYDVSAEQVKTVSLGRELTITNQMITAVLPETGGIGKKVLYSSGSALVAVFILAKRFLKI